MIIIKKYLSHHKRAFPPSRPVVDRQSMGEDFGSAIAQNWH
jgi:hypothetical protein